MEKYKNRIVTKQALMVWIPSHIKKLKLKSEKKIIRDRKMKKAAAAKNCSIKVHNKNLAESKCLQQEKPF